MNKSYTIGKPVYVSLKGATLVRKCICRLSSRCGVQLWLLHRFHLTDYPCLPFQLSCTLKKLIDVMLSPLFLSRTWSLRLQAWIWQRWTTPSRESSCPAFCVVWPRRTSWSRRLTLWWLRPLWPSWQIKGPDWDLLMTRLIWRKEVCRLWGKGCSMSFRLSLFLSYFMELISITLKLWCVTFS